jgi:putative chitinase
MNEESEIQKLNLEITRLKEETRLKKAEIELKEKEIELLRKQFEETHKTKSFASQAFSPAGVAVIVGLLGLLGTAGSLWNTSQIEDKKRQAELFIKWYERNDGKDEKQGIIELLNFKEFGYLSIPTETENALRNKIGLKKNDPVPPPSSAPIPQTAESRKIFWDRYRTTFGAASENTVAALTQIFDFIEKEKDIKDVRHVAYILATIKFETAHTFKPVTEFGDDNRFESLYGPDTPRGKLLGNTEPGDGARFKGRGYVPIVGRRNYELVNNALKFKDTDNDLIKNPEKALDPLIAYRITSYGMLNGLFGKGKLSDYITDEKADYEKARWVINGTDKAALIADIAEKFESILRESLSQNQNNQ